MKTTLFILMILCAATAFGQAGSLSSQPMIIQIPDHPEHAALTPMASEHPLVGGAADAYSYAQGEQPLWEFGAISQPKPLGDIARAYRKEKLEGKKAGIVLEKQGS